MQLFDTLLTNKKREKKNKHTKVQKLSLFCTDT